ncbi:hypothetical protein [Polynucleobacter sp. MG-27-Goln-C1]|uniref:hypothetical protein n=1 Tax=Polynucleobacter sp. MG-27-Goln-C1 TaxID=1819726 RepID=UPI001C0C436B|nr:hypothetical protein [Polynucleobacter sp. MG-27-Goln-C1]MBU3611922.1 hypothetical protein [Polynucleobacter sp. MG-27-Goln-C1]
MTSKHHKPNALILIFTVLMFLPLQSAEAEVFKFVALGDMPYSQPADFGRFERLIKTINSKKLAFSIFVGDTKSGSTPCSNEHTQKMTGYFNSFKSPLIYSIGDNEWTDCHRILAGGYNPLERLDYIRATQFYSANSFGTVKLKLQRQADVMPSFSKYVENSLWTRGGFLFVNVHIPGSNNNLGRDEESNKEYALRNQANLAWINHAFDLAAAKKYIGIIFAFQADIFYSVETANGANSGYRETVSTLRDRSESLPIPMLLIHGDSHQLKIDQPLLNRNNKPLENVYRLEVMGADQVQAVEVQVNPQESSPYSFRPLLIPLNVIGDEK